MNQSEFNAQSLADEIDLLGGKDYLRSSGRGKKELLPRSLGVDRGQTRVIDLTAGMLVDSVTLLQLGCRVLACERNPIVAAAIQLALQKAHSELAPKQSLSANAHWLSGLEFVQSDARDILLSLRERKEWQGASVLLDPMYPAKKSSALPKKSMQVFRALVADCDRDASEVLLLALESEVSRVVVKRPLKAPVLFGKPQGVVRGKLVRFDIYTP